MVGVDPPPGRQMRDIRKAEEHRTARAEGEARERAGRRSDAVAEPFDRNAEVVADEDADRRLMRDDEHLLALVATDDPVDRGARTLGDGARRLAARRREADGIVEPRAVCARPLDRALR